MTSDCICDSLLGCGGMAVESKPYVNFLITVFLNPKLKASISYSYTALFLALEYESI